MTAKDAFSLSPKQWEEIESQYEKVAKCNAEEMLVDCIQGASADQQKFLALGIMIGRNSVILPGDKA